MLHDESNLIDLYSAMNAGMLLAREEAKASKRVEAEASKQTKTGSSKRRSASSLARSAASPAAGAEPDLSPKPDVAPTLSSRFDR